MLTFLKKDHDFDGEDSEYKRLHPEEKVKMQVGSWQDLLALLVIAGIACGIYFYFQSVKEEATKVFGECAEQFQSKNWALAESCYESTWELGYVSDSMEIERQNRLGEINDLRLAQTDNLAFALASFDEGDTVSALESFNKITSPILLRASKLEQWKALGEKLPKEKVAPESGSEESSEKSLSENPEN